jgi:integrase/recombinase XerD
MKDKLILSILEKSMWFMPIDSAQNLKRLLESELYGYDITQSCTDVTIYTGVPDQLRLFLASKRLDGCSPLTIDRYKARLIHFCSNIQKSVTEVDVMDIRRYLAAYTQTGVMSSTVSTAQTALKSFFSWLEMEDIIIKSPMRKRKQIKIPDHEPKYLTATQMELLRLACKTVRERAIVEAYYSTGCRVSELYNANRDSINWGDGSLKVVGKGNKERTVFLNEKAIVHLKEYLMRRNDSEEAIFVTDNVDHNRLSVRAIQGIFSNLGKRAKINQSVHPHLLRHTVATTMLRNGAPAAAIQDMLGHSDPSTTQIYAKMDKSAVHEAHRHCS